MYSRTQIMKKEFFFLLYIMLFTIVVSCVKLADDNDDSYDNKEDESFDNPSGACIGELKKAFDYLNEVRVNPSAYSEEIGVDLSHVEARHALQWNDTLAKIANAKAKDMAKRNYFAHVNPEGYGINYYINQAGYTLEPSWLTDKSANNFESLSGGVKEGKKVIIQLIYDGGAADNDDRAGHRRHLLAMDDFWKPCIDIGIGRAYNHSAKYGWYTCIIIARHSW